MNRSDNKNLKRDTKGIEGLPLKLIIVATVLAITLPGVYRSVSHYDTQRTIQNIETQANYFTDKVEQLHKHGVGNSEVIELELNDGVFKSIDYFEIQNNTIYHQVRWSVEDEYDGRISTDENIPIMTEGSSLKLTSGSHEIRLECRYGELKGREDTTLYISAELLG